MNNILNITNGDCAVKVMKKANLPGDFLPWRDVLHEGPVPADMSLEQLSKIRAHYIAQQGWVDSQGAQASFFERDKALKAYHRYKKIILWFEHDLYDQLQLIQILDWFKCQPPSDVELTMICVDQYLGPLSPEEMTALIAFESPVTEDQLSLAQLAWRAFRSDTPEYWFSLLEMDTSALPFLEGAIHRMLEEYPSCNNGLSRSANQALKVISEGEKRPGRVFGNTFALEERRFMGDSSFWKILHEFLDASPPLLTLPEGKRLTLPTSPDQELSLTAIGREVMIGEKNWLDIHSMDRWIGGVHLTPDTIWCWNSNSRRIERHV